MANTQHKPVPHSTPAASPVEDARARALQERIRTLREQARLAGDRLLEASDRNREEQLRIWEQAEQACRQAEREMARLRARSLGAAPADGQEGKTVNARLDPDRDWDRRQAAAAALNLLERSAQPLLNSPVLEQGLARASDTASVTAAGIDFGPLVEDRPPVTPARQPARAPSDPARDAPPPRPAAAPRQDAAIPVARVANPPRPAAPRQRSRGTGRRASFATALLLGLLLGVAGLLLAATLGHHLPVDLPGLEQARQLQQAGQDLLQPLLQRLAP